MELEDIDYYYDLGKNLFKNFLYQFTLHFEQKLEEEIKFDLTNSFEKLEEILDSQILKENISKKKIGNIHTMGTIESISFGYEYVDNSSDFISSWTIRLEYNFFIKQDLVDNIRFNIRHEEEDVDRMLKVFDRIVTESEIKISKQAEKKINTINFLRNGIKNNDLYINHLLRN
ncbi:MAG: hypothetical protein ISS82_03915 [Nanoarchaeota archaeon]|nr:hypothetical protein [Nanoarchaeota archaeon]